MNTLTDEKILYINYLDLIATVSFHPELYLCFGRRLFKKVGRIIIYATGNRKQKLGESQ